MKKTERKALGRGLGALLQAAGSPGRQGELLDCPLDRIDVNEEQPRRRFDQERLQELSDSIAQSGVIQPVVVTRHGERYRLIAGERRVRASKLAGLTTVPAVVKETSLADEFELALIENIQREDLNPIEEADAYRRLIKSHGYKQDQLARRVGKNRSTVSNALRLLKLEPDEQELIATGRLTAGHARTLLGLDDKETRAQLAREIAAEGLSVREAERRGRERKQGDPKTRRPRRRPLSPLHEIVSTEIGAKLNTPVKVLPRSRRAGKLVIEYDSLETLRRIHLAITGGA